MLPAVAALAGPAAGALGQYFGQREANETNIRLQDSANATNKEEAQKNRDFQMFMSNTAHQREMYDLRKAGINPLLTAGGGGASTPAGATASTSAAKVENELGGAIASAMEAKRLGLAIDMQKEEINNMKKSGALTDAQKDKAKMETAVMRKDLPKSELINEAYETILGPAVEGLRYIKGKTQTSPKNDNLESYKKGMKTIQLKAGGY